MTHGRPGSPVGLAVTPGGGLVFGDMSERRPTALAADDSRRHCLYSHG